MPTKFEVERRVRRLHERLWHAHKQPMWHLDHLVEVLDPANVAAALGARVECVDDIPADDLSGFRAAGMLDRGRSEILVSRQFPLAERRFTAAHEIGHFALHLQQTHFRDRPISADARAAQQRPRLEVEADWFAAMLLMPPNFLRRQFELTFRVKTPFVFDDRWAFELGRLDAESLLYDEEPPLNRAFALASARSFEGRQIKAMHEQFRVTPSAMAYRLIELGLVGNVVHDRSLHEPLERRAGFAPLLPPGLHPIQEHELEALFVRPFAQPARRRELVGLLRGFLAFLRQIGIGCEVWIDGSFTTEKLAPNDIDIAIFVSAREVKKLPAERRVELELLRDRPLLKERYACDVYYAEADDKAARKYYNDLFGEFMGVKKGIATLQIAAES